jgi:hypothetical protein
MAQTYDRPWPRACAQQHALTQRTLAKHNVAIVWKRCQLAQGPRPARQVKRALDII